MAIADSNSATVDDDGSSDWVALRPGDNLLSVTSPTWGESTAAAVEQSDDGDDDEETLSSVKIDGDAVSLSANDRIVVEGPGFVRITVENYSGSDLITITRIRPE